MAKIPIKFKRVAMAFDEAARWRRPCESSSGSEYWPESETDLSNLVNSFIERSGDHRDDDDDLEDHHFDIDEIVDHENIKDDVADNNEDDEDANDNKNCESGIVNDEDHDTKREKMLQGLLKECGGGEKSGVKQKIFEEIEVALKLISGDCSTSSSSSPRDGIKRSLMAHLRDQGFDAGLCKTRWEKTGRFPAGTYEYVDVDVNVGQTRYIIEVNLAGQFDIARPTAQYTALVEMIPSIIIIEKPKVLKQIMKLMSAAMKESLKHVDLHVAPWRRNGYMQAKYFSPYKRTTNREPSDVVARREKEGLAKKRSTVSFDAVFPRVPPYCRADDFAIGKGSGVRVGLLAAALQTGK